MNMYLEHLLIGLPWEKKKAQFFQPLASCYVAAACRHAEHRKHISLNLSLLLLLVRGKKKATLFWGDLLGSLISLTFSETRRKQQTA